MVISFFEWVEMSRLMEGGSPDSHSIGPRPPPEREGFLVEVEEGAAEEGAAFRIKNLYSMILSRGRSILMVQTGYVDYDVVRGTARKGSQWPKSGMLPTMAT